MSWIYKGKKFKDPENYYGFVYIIEDNTGKWYIGKKAFTHKRKIKLSKKARIGTRKRVGVCSKDSGWQDYWGSCRPLLEYIQTSGNQGFKRTILKLCKDKSSLSYWEIDYLCTTKALFSNGSYNSNVAGKWFRGKIHE